MCETILLSYTVYKCTFEYTNLSDLFFVGLVSFSITEDSTQL